MAEGVGEPTDMPKASGVGKMDECGLVVMLVLMFQSSLPFFDLPPQFRRML